ncbi:MAG: hypothetical protein ABL898_07605 [Hyphomicrobiaceae bacterium]|nr:hypothetical protein [Hyphomicrobiaceae bacterium]
MDKLDSAIRTQRETCEKIREEVDAHRVRLEVATRNFEDARMMLRDMEIELRTLEKAASMRPLPEVAATAVVTDDLNKTVAATAKRGGRQPGSISKVWRLALGDIVSAGNQPVDADQFYLLTRGRLGLAQNSVRERLRQYAALGLLVEAGGKYCVSDTTIERFKLKDQVSGPNTIVHAQVGGIVN